MGVPGKTNIAQGMEGEWEERKWMLEEKGWRVRVKAPGQGRESLGRHRVPKPHRLPSHSVIPLPMLLWTHRTSASDLVGPCLSL